MKRFIIKQKVNLCDIRDEKPEICGFIVKKTNGVDGTYYPTTIFTLSLTDGETNASFTPVPAKGIEFYENNFPKQIAQGEKLECALGAYAPEGALFIKDGSFIFAAVSKE